MIRQRVKVLNLNRSYKISGTLVKKIAAYTLRRIKKSASALELEIVFLTDKAIRRINKRYRSKDRSTDVLSFALGGKESGSRAFLGEIFISADRAVRNSKIFGTEVTDEIALYVIHGILHLFGYDDKRKLDRSIMSRKETALLNSLRTKEDLSKVLTRR